MAHMRREEGVNSRLHKLNTSQTDVKISSGPCRYSWKSCPCGADALQDEGVPHQTEIKRSVSLLGQLVGGFPCRASDLEK